MFFKARFKGPIWIQRPKKEKSCMDEMPQFSLSLGVVINKNDSRGWKIVSIRLFHILTWHTVTSPEGNILNTSMRKI